MSGRAGRRGIDDRGIVILIVDEKMGPDVGKGLLKVSDKYRNRDYFMVGECVRFLFTSCEESQTNE